MKFGFLYLVPTARGLIVAELFSLQFSFFASVLTIGALIGAAFAGKMADLIGRRGVSYHFTCYNPTSPRSVINVLFSPLGWSWTDLWGGVRIFSVPLIFHPWTGNVCFRCLLHCRMACNSIFQGSYTYSAFTFVFWRIRLVFWLIFKNSVLFKCFK